MEITAKTRMIRISPRKVRIVADLIRKKNVNEASGLLTYMPQKGAFILKKLLDSAIANARQKKYIDVAQPVRQKHHGGRRSGPETLHAEGDGACNEDTQEIKPYNAHPG